MQIKSHLLLSLVLGCSLLLFGTLPVQAGNQSDGTGTIITSDGTGPIITSDGTGSIITTNNGKILVFRNPNVLTVINRTLLQLIAQLENVRLQGISPDIQKLLLAILRGESFNNESGSVLVNRLATVLSSAPGGPSEQLAQKLASSLYGLFANNTVNPTRFVAAVKAFNAVIAASGNDFLTKAPPHLLAIRAVLSTSLNAALAAK